MKILVVGKFTVGFERLLWDSVENYTIIIKNFTACSTEVSTLFPVV
jgi:hypothetical protein